MNKAQTRTLVEYLDARLGPHTGNGPEYRWFCPVCIDRIGAESNKQKLNVNTSRSVGHCYRCGYAFRDFAAFFRMLNNGVLKMEELRILQREVRLPTNDAVSAVRQALEHEQAPHGKLNSVTMPIDAIKLFAGKIGPFAKRALRYLHGRGVTDEMIERHQISYATSGRYAGYLLFPVLQGGEQVYFTSRFAGEATDGRKSNNPPKADGFHGKSTCLLNYDGVVGLRRVCVVEGPFDMMAWGGSAVAIMGKDISDAQILLIESLCRVGTEEVVVSLDPDAGVKAQQIYTRLLGRIPKVSVLTLPSGDPWDNRDRLHALLRTRGVMDSTAMVRARYRFGELVRRGNSYAQRV